MKYQLYLITRPTLNPLKLFVLN